MRIAYVAKHDSGGNDDEGAITNALESLGCTVDRLRELRGHVAHKMRADFLLCHHWHDMESLRRVGMPKVFWCFDLIDFPDPTLRARCDRRKSWITELTQACDIGFMTDGDWVAKDRTGKLLWLMQGADQRLVGVGATREKDIPILFTGGRNGGQKRQSFVDEMRQTYGVDFRHVERGVYGDALKARIARAKIMVAPDAPVTDRYWSNRVYTALGFGAFMLHPACAALLGHFDNALPTYSSREDLHRKIAHFLREDSVREYLADQCHRCVVADHTYASRCAELLLIVRERLGIE